MEMDIIISLKCMIPPASISVQEGHESINYTSINVSA